MKYALVVAVALAANFAQVFYLHHRWQAARAEEWIAYTKQEDRRREDLKARALALAEAERKAKQKAEEERQNAVLECLVGVVVGGVAAYSTGDPSTLAAALPACAGLL